MSKPVPFSHLHVHTEYSLLDGACRVDQLANRVKELGMESIAVTDHGVMTGLYKLQAAADKAGIKSIKGCELYFTEERAVKDPNNRYYHLTALAETTQGLHNLYKMNLRAAQEGMYYGKPRVDYELLKEYGEGVIILSGCLAGRTMQSLANSDLEPDLKKRMHAARDELIRLQDCVGKENVYVEVQNSGVKDWDGSQWEWNAQLQTLANDLGLLTVGTSDTHYLTADMAKGPRQGDPWYHDTLLCVQTRALKDQPLDKRMSLIHDWNNPHYYHLRNIEEMKKDLENVPESIPNTLVVAERCNAEIKTGRTFEMLPDFPVPEDYKTPAGQPDGMEEKIWRQQSFLRDKIWEGLHRRYGSPLPAEVVERAEYELEVINKMGTTSYFLITWDWIRYAKEIGMVVGPGRGSGCGSIVLYALDVTQLCPLEHKLLFERFLSPDRISMPDVDTDAAPVGEANYDMVRQYLREKYGEENCAQIITFQTIGGKAGIRAAARAFGPELLPLADRLAKAVPMDGAVPVPLTQALEEGVEFKQALAGGGAEAQKIIDNALWMEGLISAESVHAAAFVISPIPLTDALPIQLNKDGHPVTAFAMGEAESVGCLKLDLLGLRNLSILADAQRLIKKYQDVDVDAVNYQVPMDDAKTFEMLARGESVGVFQFECLAGDTIINGEVRTTIADMYKKPPKNLLSVDLGDGVRRRNKVLAVVQSGEKQLYRLNTSSGYTLRASADHKILTADGWKPLSAVTPEDKVVINTKDASRIGCCTECGKQTKSRSGHCHACANIARDSGKVAAANRDHDKWMANLRRGEDHPWWGKAPPQAGRMFTAPDLPYPVRSHWEADFIRAMDAVEEEFEYEPKTFEFKDGSSYTPDFYLPSRDLWVEIACKGGKSGKGKKKIDKFLKEYPGEKLAVIRGHQIAEFELANPKLAKWSCPTLPRNFDFDQVISVTLDQVEMTYDIAMEAPLNNYIANGIVVHNSGGMQDTLRAIGTTEFNDLVAIVAAYRPGAMDQIPLYARRKKGLEPVTYGDPRMEAILSETYSLILYQEQAMLLARDLAGFTGGLMDTLRKAIGKKLMDKMMELKPIFFNGTTVEQNGEMVEVPGALKNGVDKKTAEWVWSVFEASANYSFNKCLSGDTRIRLADGRRMRVSEVYSLQPKEIMSMWPDGEIRPHKVKRIVKTGNKPLYKVITESGKRIKITMEHRLLTTEGYIPLSEMKIGTELITVPVYTDEERAARSARMKEIAARPERKEQDKRAAERMRQYQASRPMEEKVAHMKRMHEQYPDLTKNATKAMHAKIAWLRENDPEWVKMHAENSLASVRATYDTGPGFGHCSIASNGMWCASHNERNMCEWLIEMEMGFEMHKVLPNGRITDFYFEGIYWEMDGMDRAHEYFEEKYGDLPFVVVTPEDYKAVISKHLGLEHAKNGDPIVSIEPVGNGSTFDIEMERGGPLNFIANNIVSHNSHAAAYALISYVTAYLKANYPVEYMSALLTSVMHTKDKVPFYLYETKRMGIEVLPPSVNESFSQFEPSGENAIRFGLTAVKGVGEGIVESIVQAREQDGPFKGIWDFAQRVDGVNRREVDNLIKAGAFDFSGETRKGMLDISEGMLKQAKKTRQKKAEGQDSLFDSLDSVEAELATMQVSDAPDISKEEFTESEMFAMEREVTGLYVSGHPLESARAAWERVRHLGVGEISEEHLSDNPDHPTVITVAGIITNKRAVYTKRDNKRMLIIQLEDLTGTAEIVVFPKLVEQGMEEYLNEGQMAYIRVALEEDTRGFSSGDDEDDTAKQIKLLARLAGPFNPDAIEVPEYYDLQIPKSALTGEVMNALLETLQRHPGEQAVRLVLLDDEGNTESTYMFPGDIRVSPSEVLGEALRDALGL